MANLPPLAPNALSTLAHVKAMLEIPADDENEQRDIILTLLINSVSAWIERMTGRNLGKQTYTQRYNASGAQELALLQWPILSVEYVKDASGGNDIPPDEYDFTTTGQFGVLYNDRGWPLRGYRGGLSYDIAAPMRCLEVKYTAGYILPKDADDENPCTLPYDLQWIVWAAIMQEFSIMQNGAQGLSAFSISDVSWTFDKNPREQWLNTIHYYTRL
jgi:hypothetical protein